MCVCVCVWCVVTECETASIYWILFFWFEIDFEISFGFIFLLLRRCIGVRLVVDDDHAAIEKWTKRAMEVEMII